jgi:hypothetical protein
MDMKMEIGQDDESRDQLASPNNEVVKGWQVVKVKNCSKRGLILAHGLLKTCFVDKF